MVAAPEGRSRHRIRTDRAYVHMWSSPKTVGLFLLVAALIPIGDMLTVLAAEGSAKSAFGIHGLTASLLLLAGMWLSMGRG
jgi:hypothetical protein